MGLRTTVKNTIKKIFSRLHTNGGSSQPEDWSPASSHSAPSMDMPPIKPAAKPAPPSVAAAVEAAPVSPPIEQSPIPVKSEPEPEAAEEQAVTKEPPANPLAVPAVQPTSLPNKAPAPAAENTDTVEPPLDAKSENEIPSTVTDGAFAVYKIKRLFPDTCGNCGAPSHGNWKYEDKGYSCVLCGEPYS